MYLGRSLMNDNGNENRGVDVVSWFSVLDDEEDVPCWLSVAGGSSFSYIRYQCLQKMERMSSYQFGTTYWESTQSTDCLQVYTRDSDFARLLGLHFHDVDARAVTRIMLPVAS